MENCKISEAEAERVLVKRVNNRPNAMATYGMAKMSPTYTKDIFDKQFALVKEKHNLLVDKIADIYQEQEQISEQVGDHSERLNDIEDKIDKIQVPDSNIAFKTDETLSLVNGVLSVNTAEEPDPDNTLPITAAAVASTVGNIEIILKTI